MDPRVVSHTLFVWIAHYGYIAIFLVLGVESLGIPSPSEITLVLAGVAVSQGRLSYPLVIAVGALGSTTGAAVAYTIARRGGRPLILHYGRRVGLGEQRLADIEHWFETRGAWAIVIGRILSGVRALISYPAGIVAMPMARFLTLTAVGAVLWPLIAVSAGWAIGPHWRQGLRWMEHGSVALVVVLALAVAGWVGYRRRHPRRDRP